MITISIENAFQILSALFIINFGIIALIMYVVMWLRGGKGMTEYFYFAGLILSSGLYFLLPHTAFLLLIPVMACGYFPLACRRISFWRPAIFGVGVLIEVLNYFFRFMPAALAYQIAFMIFVLIHIIGGANYTHDIESDNLENRIKVMLSQIQPHFLFNVLNTIQHLCSTNPKNAEKAVGTFAKYLRQNIDSLAQMGLISLEKELEYVRNYVALEQMRFGDRVKIQYDLKARHFLIPPLIIQPLVENAIKHGITKKFEGGTVKISTRKDGENFIIEISDDGIGFDGEINKGERRGIALKNIADRLSAQCGGTLSIKSSPGSGTVAEVRI